MAVRRGVAARDIQQEVPEPMEQVMSEEPSRKRPWERVDADGNKIKRKKVPGAKNARIRKHVQPRNACQCLHEIVPSDTIIYGSPEEDGTGQHRVSVTVEGKAFYGKGPSVKIARQNAAEAALMSFVKPPMPKAAPGVDDEMEDKTPWAPLASFAMYKLFIDWNNGRIGVGQPQIRQGDSTPTVSSDAITEHLNNSSAGLIMSPESVKNGKPAKPQENLLRPAKQVPDNAAAMHPVMVLHQMKPGIEYITNKTNGADNKPYFYVSANLDGQEFTGEGINYKKARFQLAKDAIFALFGVESCFELPG